MKNPIEQSYLRLPRLGGAADGATKPSPEFPGDEGEDLLISEGDIAIEEAKRADQGKLAANLGFDVGDRVSFKGEKCVIIDGPDEEGLYTLHHLSLGASFLTGPHDLELAIEVDMGADFAALQTIVEPEPEQTAEIEPPAL